MSNMMALSNKMNMSRSSSSPLSPSSSPSPPEPGWLLRCGPGRGLPAGGSGGTHEISLPWNNFLWILFTFFVVVIFSHHLSGRHFLLRNYKLRGKFLVFHYNFGIRLLAERMRPHIPETIFL